MSINSMTKDDLELLSHKDITNLLLAENGAMNTADLFKKITTLLELPASTFEKKIGDYYTTLTTDKRFLLLEDGKWDLRTKHTSDKVIIVAEEQDDEDEEEEDLKDEPEEDLTDDYDSAISDEDDFDDGDDDLKDLVVLDEEELELEE
jgi:DNA-directed RNA polymerase subunit delta